MAQAFVFTAGNREFASPGEVLLAELPLPRGLYVVFAKFDVEFNSAFPAIPGARGIARLLVPGDPQLGDSGWSGANESTTTETIVLMACGAVFNPLHGGLAQLFFSPGAAVSVDKIKITAISLDGLSSNFLGQGNVSVTLPSLAGPTHPVLPLSP